jgi:ubiquitin-activating enzyme E1
MDVDMKDAHDHVEGDIDESLYSRQLYVMGHEAQRKMGNSTVLIVGLRGLGVEIAKNVILAGVRGVVLHDDHPVEIADLSSNFYFTENDVGKPRSTACASQLAELNNYVNVSIGSGTSCLTDVSQYACVCVTDQVDGDFRLKISDACHAANTPYVQGDMRGLFASMFCDFGTDFVCSDTDGEQPLSVVVSAIDENSDDAVVTVSEGNRHGMSDGMYVTFSEVPGTMGPHLNGCQPRGPIKCLTPYTFSIGSTREQGKFDVECGIPGIVEQVKVPQKFTFKSLRDSLTSPGDFCFTDFGKWDRPGLLHQAFRGLDE